MYTNISLRKFIHSCHSPIRPTNICEVSTLRAGDSVAKTETACALMELSGHCGLETEGVIYECYRRESPGSFVTWPHDFSGSFLKIHSP